MDAKDRVQGITRIAVHVIGGWFMISSGFVQATYVLPIAISKGISSTKRTVLLPDTNKACFMVYSSSLN